MNVSNRKHTQHQPITIYMVYMWWVEKWHSINKNFAACTSSHLKKLRHFRWKLVHNTANQTMTEWATLFYIVHVLLCTAATNAPHTNFNVALGVTPSGVVFLVVRRRVRHVRFVQVQPHKPTVALIRRRVYHACAGHRSTCYWLLDSKDRYSYGASVRPSPAVWSTRIAGTFADSAERYVT